MRLNLPRFLLLLQFYFHIAHEALISHTHFTFYCCTPVNLLKPSHSSFAGCARANLRSTIATAHCFKSYNMHSHLSHLRSSRGIHRLLPSPPFNSVSRSFSCIGNGSPATAHTHPHAAATRTARHIPCKTSAYHLASYKLQRCPHMLTPASGRDSEPTV